MRPLSRHALAAAALATLLVGCGGPGATTGGSSDVGRAGAPSASAPSTSASSSSAPPSAGSVPAVGRSVPVGLRIPAIGVDTPVMKLGLAADGTVQVPPITAHDEAGWYEHSPTPGQMGPSVILGHVTVGAYGDGVFRHLEELHRGEKIVARLENGTAAEFSVTGVRTVAKDHFPTHDVYGNVDRPELRLITCGGALTGDGYRDNVIVFARLSSTSR
ncbi:MULTISPECIES: class F sortase [Streptomyces]|jgi:LPXTG-site transpeptidase (sortase) family protein|uniref:class F sortase n=1 Tax=Streptomyces TaxID=1883 RepID=UPI000D39F3B9|nr:MULTISPECIES: class F sortase [Streptomyces]MBY8344970.1 class F sortase [Streptomyces plumbidurans]PTM86293.1 LPXTG-site transpeptidase (sortase) family protein [Streptomyces sp. VMFN-G11Ma]